MKIQILKNVLYVGSYFEDYCRNYTFIQTLKQNKINVFEVNIRELCKKNKILKLFKELRKLNKQNLDLIIFYSLETFSLPFIIARFYAFIKRIPFIHDIFISKLQTYYYDRDLYIIKKRLKIKLYYWFYYYLLDFFECHFSNYVILDTLSHIKFFHEKYNVPLKKFKKVYVGAREDVFFPIDAASNKDKKFKIGFWGSYIPLHGIEYIIKSAKILENNEDIRFILIGRGQTYKRNKNLVTKLNLRNIEFIPKDFLLTKKLDELPKLISKLDIGLGIFGNSDKAKQIIPNKLFEGIAMKIPMITSKNPAINELFTENENIILCKSSNPESLAEAILSLKKSKELREKITENAFKLFQKNCSFEVIGNSLIKILNGILVNKIKSKN